jgi:hypothetical protein
LGHSIAFYSKKKHAGFFSTKQNHSLPGAMMNKRLALLLSLFFFLLPYANPDIIAGMIHSVVYFPGAGLWIRLGMRPPGAWRVPSTTQYSRSQVKGIFYVSLLDCLRIKYSPMHQHGRGHADELFATHCCGPYGPKQCGTLPFS